MKVSQPKDNKHTVGCEQKLKVVSDFMSLGECDSEVKFSNAGANCWTTNAKADWDCLKVSRKK